MKIHIDTEKKVIQLESSENFGMFLDAIKIMLPNETWRDYTLKINVTIQSAPIIIETHPPITPYITYPTYLPPYPTITCQTVSSY